MGPSVLSLLAIAVGQAAAFEWVGLKTTPEETYERTRAVTGLVRTYEDLRDRTAERWDTLDTSSLPCALATGSGFVDKVSSSPCTCRPMHSLEQTATQPHKRTS
jgi:hypothetical protein